MFFLVLQHITGFIRNDAKLQKRGKCIRPFAMTINYFHRPKWGPNFETVRNSQYTIYPIRVRIYHRRLKWRLPYCRNDHIQGKREWPVVTETVKDDFSSTSVLVLIDFESVLESTRWNGIDQNMTAVRGHPQATTNQNTDYPSARDVSIT